jgi:hypothetical protein
MTTLHNTNDIQNNAQLVCVAVAVGFPWYFIQVKQTLPALSSEECTVLSLRAWRYAYCHKAGDACDAIGDVCPDDRVNWRDQCEVDGTNVCGDVPKVFNITLIMMCSALLLALISAAWFCMRCCSVNHRGRNNVHVAVNVLLLLALIAAVGYFAIAYPIAAKQAVEDNDGDCEIGPCDSFFGHKEADYLDIKWGGAGWLIAVLAMVLSMFSICLSCSRAAGDGAANGVTENYYNMHDDSYLDAAGATGHGSSAYVQQRQQAAHQPPTQPWQPTVSQVSYT